MNEEITGIVTETVRKRMKDISSGKLYRGKRIKYRRLEITIEGDGKLSRILLLPRMQPGGIITWESSGDMTDVSLGILLDFFDEAPEDEDLNAGKTEAQKHFIGFRGAFIRPFRMFDEWTIGEADIRTWIRVYAAETLFGSEVVVTGEGDEDDLREDGG